MSIRDLIFSASFQGDASDLIKMDNAVDDLKDNALDATDNISGMESATDDLSTTTGKSGNIISNNWKAVTGTMVAVSAAAEGITRTNAPLFESIEQVSLATNISRDELQDLATEMTNVTFPLEDVTQLMQIAGQQGLTTAEELKDFGNFWDTVGDAIGGSGPALGEAGMALRALGIEAGNESEALAAFGYITESTTGDVDEFLQFINRAGPNLREMGVDVDETAALLGILEHEFGMSGRTARSEFNKAVSESDGDLQGMYDSLGVTTDMLTEYTGKVKGSGDVIQDYADIHAETYTLTEKLGHKISELGFKYGDTIRTVANFAPALTAIGPVAKGVEMAQASMSTGLLSKVVPAFMTGASGAWAFTTALLANPITWIIVGIVALGAAIWALSTDFGGVTTFIKDKFGQATDWIKEKFSSTVEWFKGIPESFKEVGSNVITSFITGFTEKLGALKDTVVNAASSVGNWFKGKLGIASPSKVMISHGLDTGEGVNVGLKKSLPRIRKTTNDMANNIETDGLGKQANTTIRKREVSGNFNPSINITVEGNADNSTVQNLESTIKRIMEREQAKFWSKMALTQA